MQLLFGGCEAAGIEPVPRRDERIRDKRGDGGESVRSWVKKVCQAEETVKLERGRRWADGKPTNDISFDDMWTYVGSRRKGKRNSVWVYGAWTAVVEDGDGNLWHGYEVGGSDEAAFVKLYERMPDARL